MSIRPIDINGFKSTSLLSGTHKAARFICVVEPPPVIASENEFDNESLAFLCSAAAIPAVNIQTTEEHHWPGASLKSHMPYGVTLGELQLKYYVDSNASAYELYSAWLRNIVGHGAPNTPFQGNDTAYNGTQPAEVQYKSHYASTVRLYALDTNNAALLEVVFYDAYPTAISDVQFDWSTTDDISSFTVTFAYYTYVPMKYKLEMRPSRAGGSRYVPTRSRTVSNALFGTTMNSSDIEDLIGSVTQTLTSNALPGLKGGIQGLLQGALSQFGRSIVGAALGSGASAINSIKSMGANIRNYKSSLKSAVVNKAKTSLGKALRNFP